MKNTYRSRSGRFLTSLASAQCGLKLIHSEIFWDRATRLAAAATGRGSATFISRMASGTENAFCREGYVKFVSTPAPAWVADKLPIYGGFFWINGLGQYPVPRESYYMAGAGGQTTMIVPSYDLVVVRLGHYKGEATGTVALRRALTLLLEAVPQRN